MWRERRSARPNSVDITSGIAGRAAQSGCRAPPFGSGAVPATCPVRGSVVLPSSWCHGRKMSPSPSSSAPNRPATPTLRADEPVKNQQADPQNRRASRLRQGIHGPAGMLIARAVQSLVAAASRSPRRFCASSGSSSSASLVILVFVHAHRKCYSPIWLTRLMQLSQRAAASSADAVVARPSCRTASSGRVDPGPSAPIRRKCGHRGLLCPERHQMIDRLEYGLVGDVIVLGDRVHRVGADHSNDG